MSNPVHCTSCGAPLIRHCDDSKTCPWLKCIGHRPPMIYDLDHGKRLVDSTILEPIVAPPAADGT